MSLHTIQASPLKFKPPVVVTAAYDAETLWSQTLDQIYANHRDGGVEFDPYKVSLATLTAMLLESASSQDISRAFGSSSITPEVKTSANTFAKEVKSRGVGAPAKTTPTLKPASKWPTRGSTEEVQARIKGLDEYAWFTFTRAKPLSVTLKNKEFAISKGDVFGVRWSSNKKDKRLVLARPDAGMTRVITITNNPELEAALEKFSVPSRAEIAEEFMTAVTASTLVTAAGRFDMLAFLKGCGVPAKSATIHPSLKRGDAVVYYVALSGPTDSVAAWKMVATKMCEAYSSLFGPEAVLYPPSQRMIKDGPFLFSIQNPYKSRVPRLNFAVGGVYEDDPMADSSTMAVVYWERQ